jgi:hypothetical protein
MGDASSERRIVLECVNSSSSPTVPCAPAAVVGGGQGEDGRTNEFHGELSRIDSGEAGTFLLCGEILGEGGDTVPIPFCRGALVSASSTLPRTTTLPGTPLSGLGLPLPTGFLTIALAGSANPKGRPPPIWLVAGKDFAPTFDFGRLGESTVVLYACSGDISSTSTLAICTGDDRREGGL